MMLRHSCSLCAPSFRVCSPKVRDFDRDFLAQCSLIINFYRGGARETCLCGGVGDRRTLSLLNYRDLRRRSQPVRSSSSWLTQRPSEMSGISLRKPRRPPKCTGNCSSVSPPMQLSFRRHGTVTLSADVGADERLPRVWAGSSA